MLVDTHCHIQSISGKSDNHTAKKWRGGGVTDADKVINDAANEGVKTLICVGTDLEDSQNVVRFVRNRGNCYASIGVHPHEAKQFLSEHKDLSEFDELAGTARKIVAVGEVGLDYYYEHSPKAEQTKLLEMFLDLAQTNNLPVIFHVRDAYDDFWPIYDNFRNIKGVLHSFSSDVSNLEKAMSRGLCVGLNGIMTFTKDESQLAVAKAVPANRVLLETDAPYLAPKPHRGKVCQPAHVKTICEFLCTLRGESIDEFAAQTTKNAKKLFQLD